jgi:hypothetical protein
LRAVTPANPPSHSEHAFAEPQGRS